jgi:hypothetical protein
MRLYSALKLIVVVYKYRWSKRAGPFTSIVLHCYIWKLKVKHGFSIATFTQTQQLTGAALQVGRLQLRTSGAAMQTVAYDRLAMPHTLLQLVQPSVVHGAALRTLAPAEAGTNLFTPVRWKARIALEAVSLRLAMGDTCCLQFPRWDSNPGRSLTSPSR